MKKTNLRNYFTVSPALIKSNLKNYWYLAVITLFVFFFTNIFGLILTDDTQSFYYVTTLFGMKNPAVWIYLCLVPLISACVMTGWLHNPVKALTISSQPYSRGKIYASNVLSGWLMMVIPVAVIALVTGIVLHSGLYNPDYAEHILQRMAAEGVTGYTVAQLGLYSWLLKVISIITFFYALCVLACAVSGTSAMGIILSGIFALLPTAIIGVFELYMDSFLKGFTSLPESVTRIIALSNPAFGLFMNGFSVSINYSIFYLVAGVIMLVISAAVNSITPFERLGESIVFRVVDILISAVVATGSAILVGLFCYEIFDRSMPTLYIGMAVGLLLGWFVIRIITEKSIRIFERIGFCALALALAMVMLFSMITTVDLFGYAKRVPDINKIESVDCYSVIDNWNVTAHSGSTMMTDEDVWQADRDFIEKVVNLEKYVADNELYNIPDGKTIAYAGNTAYLENFEENRDDYVVLERLRFEYMLLDGRTFERQYQVVLTDELKDLINEIMRDDTYLSARLIDTEHYDNIAEMRVNFYGTCWVGTGIGKGDVISEYADRKDYDSAVYDEGVNLRIAREDYDKVIEALNRDVQAADYDKCLDWGQRDDGGSLEIFYETDSKGGNIGATFMGALVPQAVQEFENSNGRNMMEDSISVNTGNENLIACLYDLGYLVDRK